MLRRSLCWIAAGSLLASVFTTAAAHEFEAGTLVVGHPWARPTSAGMPMGVAYLTITNRGDTADSLIAASSVVAGAVEIHETRIVGGMAQMRPLAELVIPPGATVKIEPNGVHLMLIGLKSPLQRGASAPLTLEFRRAGKVTVQLSIEARDIP